MEGKMSSFLSSATYRASSICIGPLLNQTAKKGMVTLANTAQAKVREQARKIEMNVPQQNFNIQKRSYSSSGKNSGNSAAPLFVLFLGMCLFLIPSSSAKEKKEQQPCHHVSRK
jgi:hypothetical protein